MAEAPAGPRRALALHGALDLAFAALYAWLGLAVVPSRQPWFTAGLLVIVALLCASGLALLVRWRGARWLALLTQGLLLACCLTLIALLVASAAYLRGIYGPLGEAASAIALLVAALLVEVGGLLPLFQIAFLLRPEVARLLAPPAGAADHG